MEEFDAGSDHILIDQLAEEFVSRHRRGENPSLAEYVDRHPEWADEIHELFPALVMMEQLKPATAELASRPAGGAGTAGRMPGRLGDYRIIRELGRGGMGVVYEAVQEALGRHVALKVLPWHGQIDPDAQERFRNEARSAARLHHTNIVPVFDVGEHEGVRYYSMQFIRGTGLDAIIRDLRRLREEPSKPRSDPMPGQAPTPDGPGARGPRVDDSLGTTVTYHEEAAHRSAESDREARAALDAEAAEPSTLLPGRSELASPSEARYYQSVARIGVQVAEALAYAHGRGVLHRDIKPSNLLLDAQGTAWVADFGLAKAEGSQGPTRTGDIVGTLRYMAPERLDGRSTALSDVYSLGATLYELITLRPLFEEGNRSRLIDRVLHDAPVAPRRIDPQIPRDLETICLKCLEKDPSRRYATAQALADDLRSWLGSRPIAARPVGAAERTWLWAKRRPAIAATGAAAVLGLLATTTLSVAWGVQQADLARHRANAVRTERTLRAEAERQTALANNRLDRMMEAVEDYYTGVGEEALLAQPEMRTLHEQLLDKPRRFYERTTRELASQPRPDDRERALLARSRRNLGRILYTLGRHAEARVQLEASVTAYEALAKARPDDPGPRAGLASAYTHLGVTLASTGRLAEAERAHRAAIAAWEAVADPDARDGLPLSLTNLGAVLQLTNRPVEAERAFREAIAVSRQLVAARPAVHAHRSLMAGCYTNLGNALAASGRLPDAEQAHREAVATWTALVAAWPAVPSHHDGLALSLTNLGVVLHATGRPVEAERAFREAIAASRQLVAARPAVPLYQYGLASRYFNLGRILQDADRAPEAEGLLRKAAEIGEAVVAAQPDVPRYQAFLAGCHDTLALLLVATGRPGEAATRYRRAIAIDEALVARHRGVIPYEIALAGALVNCGNLARDQGDPEEAIGLLDRAVAVLGEVLGRESAPQAIRFARNAYWGRARALDLLGRGAAAESDWDRAIALSSQDERPSVIDERSASRAARGSHVLIRAAIEHARRGAPAAALERVAPLMGRVSALPPAMRYNLACTLAVCAGALHDDAVAAQAVALLDQADTVGFFASAENRDRLGIDPDLATLRGRDDFRAFRLDLAMPAEPFAR